MLEVYPNLFLGCQADYEANQLACRDWHIVHACKEPYHREALGYRTRGAPPDHPEYLFALRPKRLILNLVDVENAAYIRDEIMDTAVRFIAGNLAAGQQVLVHCNQGMSRSPGIVMLYLGTHTDRLSVSFEEAQEQFCTIYPPFAPAGGVLDFLRRRWSLMASMSKSGHPEEI